MDKKSLKGGANLYIYKSDKFKSWSASIYIYRPLTAYDATYNALLAKVIKTSTEKYPSRAKLTEKLDLMYGAMLSTGVRKYADTHALIINIKAVCDKFLSEKISGDVLEFARQVIENPNVHSGMFDESTVELEKENLKKQIESYINDKTFYADLRGLEVLCGDDNYAIDVNGTIEILEQITPHSLYEHYLNLMENSQKDIFLCGDADEKCAEEVFANLKTIKNESKVKRFIPKAELITKFDEMDVTQGKLIMGFCFSKTDNSYRCAAMVYNAIFGGSAVSKLFNNVREKLSLAYYANTRMSFSKGIIFARAGIEISKYNETKEEILNQLDSIKNGNITDDELFNAKAHLVNLYTSLEDDPESMISLVSGWITENETRNVDDIIEGIKNVTKEDIIEIAKDMALKAIYFLKNKEVKP